MNVIATTVFNRKINNTLGLTERYKASIIDDFKTMTNEQASRQSYFKAGKYKFYKKYRKGDYRIAFAYCKECFTKYKNILQCSSSICNKNYLEQLVLFDIWHRSEGY